MPDSFSYYDTPEHPLREALQAMTGVVPPDSTLGRYSTRGMSDKDILDLQDWCCLNARPDWGTGIGLLEAAEHIVEEAVENANIQPPSGTLAHVEQAVADAVMNPKLKKSTKPSSDYLEEKLTVARKTLHIVPAQETRKVYPVWRHKKSGRLYLATSAALFERTLEVVVNYQPMGEDLQFMRPMKEFLDKFEFRA